MKHTIIILTILFFTSLGTNSQIKSLKIEDFNVLYEECAEEYVKASLKVLQLVKSNAISMGFVFPKKIDFIIIKSDKNRLFFDKENPNKITWQFVSLNDFLSPAKSGFNNIYGLCHEMGHICMFNITPHKNNWMTSDYREGWADYFGNLMVDSVYETLGFNFWPDSHNYLEFAGMKYFLARLESDTSDQNRKFNYCSLFWYKLSNQIGIVNISSYFKSLKAYNVRNPNCYAKFVKVMGHYNSEPDFLLDLERNKDALLIMNE